MKRSKHIIRTLVLLCIMPIIGSAQPQRAPAGLTSGLFAWFDGTSFDAVNQQWNSRVGGPSLVRYAATGTPNITLTPPGVVLNQQPYLEMDGVGLRGELLPSNALNASYTVFAVSSRMNQIKPTPQYTETAWGFGAQSAYPGFVQSPSAVNQHTFRNTTNRSTAFAESWPRGKSFLISSLAFGYGSDNIPEPRIASINGESLAMDAGNVLPLSNGYVYVNANAAFPPASPYQHHRFAEFIIYNRKLTDTERYRVQTFLSLKYAISLLTGVPAGSRITMDGTTDLWDSSQNFNTDVIGIGRYDAAGLDVRSSYGIDPDVFISTVGSASVSANNSFLLIGDKGTHHQSASVANTVAIPGGKRLKRIWRVQNTGFIDSVYLRTPSTAVPDGGLSLDACAPVRLLISDDSTFTTYRAVKLTPFSVYGNSVPPLFSAYTANIKFRQGESYFTYAGINTPGTPVALQENSDTQNFETCADDEGYHYFTDAQGRPVFAVKGLSASQISQYGLHAIIRVLNQPVSVSNGSTSSTMMKRLLSVTSSPFAPGVKATIRFYFRAQELAEAKVTGGTDYWFKKTGASVDATITDFSGGGVLDASTSTALNGIEGTQNGTDYVEFRDLESFSTFGFISSMSVLPVRLISFNGKSENRTTQLSWQTSEELNSDYFEIERSVDASKWDAIGVVKASGTTTLASKYTFADKSRVGEDVYYRLKMVDLDGTTTFSRILFISGKPEARELTLFPNPAQVNFVRLSDNFTKHQKIRKVVFLDQRGVSVYQVEHILSADVNISKLTPGSYSVVVTMDSGESVTRRLVINH